MMAKVIGIEKTLSLWLLVEISKEHNLLSAPHKQIILKLEEIYSRPIHGPKKCNQ